MTNTAKKMIQLNSNDPTNERIATNDEGAQGRSKENNDANNKPNDNNNSSNNIQAKTSIVQAPFRLNLEHVLSFIKNDVATSEDLNKISLAIKRCQQHLDASFGNHFSVPERALLQNHFQFKNNIIDWEESVQILRKPVAGKAAEASEIWYAIGLSRKYNLTIDVNQFQWRYDDDKNQFNNLSNDEIYGTILKPSPDAGIDLMYFTKQHSRPQIIANCFQIKHGNSPIGYNSKRNNNSFALRTIRKKFNAAKNRIKKSIASTAHTNIKFRYHLITTKAEFLNVVIQDEQKIRKPRNGIEIQLWYKNDIKQLLDFTLPLLGNDHGFMCHVFGS